MGIFLWVCKSVTILLIKYIKVSKINKITANWQIFINKHLNRKKTDSGVAVSIMCSSQRQKQTTVKQKWGKDSVTEKKHL